MTIDNFKINLTDTSCGIKLVRIKALENKYEKPLIEKIDLNNTVFDGCSDMASNIACSDIPRKCPPTVYFPTVASESP